MNLIKELNIDENILKRIIDINDESIIYTIENNLNEIKTSIDYLNKIGIKPINELLIYEIDYLIEPERIKQIKKDNTELINSINNDYIYIENI